MKRTIEVILNDLKAALQAANIDLDGVPARSLPSFEMSKRQATDDAVVLKKEYVTRIMGISRAFVTTGDPQKALEYAAVAAREGATITVDAQELYKKIADRVEPSLGSTREFTVNQLFLLHRALEVMAAELGLSDLSAPRLRELRVCATAADTTAYIRELVRGSCGDVLNLTYLQSVIGDRALEMDFKGQLLPIVLLNVDGEDLRGMFRQAKLVPLTQDTVVDVGFAISTFKNKAPKNESENKQ
jgi:hypothetical protein